MNTEHSVKPHRQFLWHQRWQALLTLDSIKYKLKYAMDDWTIRWTGRGATVALVYLQLCGAIVGYITEDVHHAATLTCLDDLRYQKAIEQGGGRPRS